MMASIGCPVCEHLSDESYTPIATPPLIDDDMTVCFECLQVWLDPEEEEENA